MGNGVREARYWEEIEKRVCRVCGNEEETWEHVWERCRERGDIGSWQENVREVLGGRGGRRRLVKSTGRRQEQTTRGRKGRREREGEQGEEERRRTKDRE